jgi:hypothetical protein
MAQEDEAPSERESRSDGAASKASTPGWFLTTRRGGSFVFRPFVLRGASFVLRTRVGDCSRETPKSPVQTLVNVASRDKGHGVPPCP